MRETYLAKAISATGGVSTEYDKNVKFLLSDRQILAYIIKYSVTEFMSMSIKAIMNCIGDDIEVATKSTEPGLTNLGKITGTATECTIPNEGSNTFDIRFSVYSPNGEYKFLINVEAQKHSYASKLGYHLKNRVVFYLARMISAQKETEFINDNYDDMKKSISIWLCMNSKKNEDSIEEIYLDKRTLFGNPPEYECPDLMRGIIIRLRSRENVQESKNQLIAMLETLLSKQSAETKKNIMSQKYGLIISTDLERRINTMCNLSEVILEDGLREGLEKGLEKGRKTERRNIILNMLKKKASYEQISDFLDLPIDEIKKIEKESLAKSTE